MRAFLFAPSATCVLKKIYHFEISPSEMEGFLFFCKIIFPGQFPSKRNTVAISQILSSSLSIMVRH